MAGLNIGVSAGAGVGDSLREARDGIPITPVVEAVFVIPRIIVSVGWRPA